LTEESADIYNPKTIRATMGAIFKQSIYLMNINEIKKLKQKGIRFIGASNEYDSIDITKAEIKNAVIILGNEGQGISGELRVLCDEMIKIPVADNCESINVAAAASIIMWEARQG